MTTMWKNRDRPIKSQRNSFLFSKQHWYLLLKHSFKFYVKGGHRGIKDARNTKRQIMFKRIMLMYLFAVAKAMMHYLILT